MEITSELSFDHEDRRRIYEYVERHGPTPKRELRQSLGIDAGGLRHHLALLRRDGYISESGSRVEVAYDEGAIEEHRGQEVTFVVRQARQADLSGLVGAIRQVAEEGTYIEAESVAAMLDHEQVLLRHNDVESRIFFVATVEDEVVGWVHLHIPETEKLAHTAELTVGVVEGYRGQGIGSQLLQRGVQWAGTNGYEKLYNSAPATNDRAIAFLEEHGWTIEAVREDHYRIEGELVDEVMMALSLT
ncbi:MAG: GNAT family N-acetyltransferase [Halobacteriaceae archaeon]